MFFVVLCIMLVGVLFGKFSSMLSLNGRTLCTLKAAAAKTSCSKTLMR